MKFNKIYILLCVVFFSLSNVYGYEKKDSLYKIMKIDTTKEYYIIHAEKNDSLFKIISKKVAFNNEKDLKVIKKGNYYYFNFKNNKNSKEGNLVPLTGIINNLDIKNNHTFIDGNTKIKLTKRFHYRLYTTKNLIGIYYNPDM